MGQQIWQLFVGDLETKPNDMTWILSLCVCIKRSFLIKKKKKKEEKHQSFEGKFYTNTY